MGHIFAKYDKNAVSKVRNIVKRLAQGENMPYDDYVTNNISEYASHSDEIIAELNAMRRGSNSELADFIWKEALNP